MRLVAPLDGSTRSIWPSSNACRRYPSEPPHPFWQHPLPLSRTVCASLFNGFACFEWLGGRLRAPPSRAWPVEAHEAETPRRSLTYEWCAAALLPNLQSQERAIIDAVAPLIVIVTWF